MRVLEVTRESSNGMEDEELRMRNDLQSNH